MSSSNPHHEQKQDERKLLGDTLVQAGIITPEQLELALKEEAQNGGRIGFNLVKLGFVAPEKLAGFLKEGLGVGIMGGTLAEREKASDAIPRQLALYYKIAPIRLEKGTLTVGIARIEHPNLMQALQEVTGYRIDPLIFPDSEIRALIDTSYKLHTARGLELFPFSDNIFAVVDKQKRIQPLAAGQLKNEKDVGEWLRSIIADAIKDKSREILVKPEADGSTVSFRKDTFFLSNFSFTAQLHDDLTFLIFRLAKLDPLQQQKPQHGRFLVKILDRRILMVVSSYPTIYGVRFLLEMFDERMLRTSFEELAGQYSDLKQLLEDFMLRARKGMVMITGPEGSGRSSLLYGYLSRCKEEFQEVFTLENAVHYPISGVTQTQVEPAEMDTALEEVLKQRPELLAINSLRTRRSVELAFLTAARMPVISVISSYDCYMAIDWLCRNRLKSAIKAGLLSLVIAPRMIARVCSNCSVPYEPTDEQKQKFHLGRDLPLKMNQGCDLCRSTDHHVAETVLEYVRIDPEMIGWIEENHNASALRNRAREAGRKTLFDVALQRGLAGSLDMPSVLKLHSVF